MAFHVEELSLELIDALAPLMPRIRQSEGDSSALDLSVSLLRFCP